MTPILNVVAVFEQGSSGILRCEVFKSDGDVSQVDGPHNRYVYVCSQLKPISAVWDRRFLGFEVGSINLN